MISQITGTLIEQNEKEVVIDVGGIGYSIATIPTFFPVGATLTFYTHLVIKDDAHELYGFQTKDERALFRILIGVSGVGPKTALHMLSLYTIGDIVRIIRRGDAKAIALVPGIGKKTAEKVAIDLKDKLDGFVATEGSISVDLVEALLSLGYKEQQIRPIASAIDATLPIEKQITEALKVIQK